MFFSAVTQMLCHEDREAMGSHCHSAFHMAGQGAHDSLFHHEQLLEVNGCQESGVIVFTVINTFVYAPTSYSVSVLS